MSIKVAGINEVGILHFPSGIMFPVSQTYYGLDPVEGRETLIPGASGIKNTIRAVAWRGGPRGTDDMVAVEEIYSSKKHVDALGPVLEDVLDGAGFEAIKLFVEGTELMLWFDRDGKFKRLPPTLRLPGDFIAGPIVITTARHTDAGRVCSMNSREAQVAAFLLGGCPLRIEWPSQYWERVRAEEAVGSAT
jgi:hypothetical protein